MHFRIERRTICICPVLFDWINSEGINNTIQWIYDADLKRFKQIQDMLSPRTFSPAETLFFGKSVQPILKSLQTNGAIEERWTLMHNDAISLYLIGRFSRFLIELV